LHRTRNFRTIRGGYFFIFKIMDLILVGIQGAGKGTQAKLLEERFGYRHFETGAELRKIAKEPSELGRKIKEITDSGAFASSALTMDLIQNFLDHLKEGEHIIIDGTPRFEEQRQDLEKLYEKNNRKFKVVKIHLSEEEAIKRLLRRGEIEGRSDDNLETIKKRIANFITHTRPLIRKWDEEGICVHVNGENEVEKVHEDIIKELAL